MPAPVPVYEPRTPDDPPLIGGYRVLARIGAGGMGRVYLATTQSGRKLAIKVVRPEFAEDPEFRRRFQQEIAAAQRVQSFYTAPVIDAHADGPQPWLATAHVPGPSLAQTVVELGPLPEATVRAVFAGVAEALQAVHAAGVVHRDLKPSNVLLAPDGPRVIDFGIARAADTTPLTRTGMRIGSPQYMAPEQALGRPSTPAVDMFALAGVVLFAATGRTPFGEGPAEAVLFRVVHEEPVLDGCPDGLRDLVERCLAKDPADRPTPRDVLDALEVGTDPPGAGWLPEDVTRRLPAYSAEPPRPMGPPTSGPGFDPVPVPPAGAPVPAAAPVPAVRLLLLALAAAGVVIVVLAAALVVLRPWERDAPGAAAHRPPESLPAAHESSTATQTAGPDLGGPSRPAPGGVGAQLGHYANVNLASGYAINLSDDPKHPKASRGGEDLRYDGTLWGDRLSVLAPGQPGGYEACRDNTRYADYLGDDYLVKGKRICVTTESGLVGLVEVRGTGDKPSAYLAFDLTVWQGVPPTPGG
ncbi:Serine/threonine-protein kinase AfsK [Actinomadura rubteroloni]|uniref:Serine/threonine-protein kinase AfsK n=1 Tax=Actinomadura rubteroloni TaxID=1926885 RepID=A0A2P4URA7_9ACTN|nr:serine/threonine-protein kinase [Actinomadura rubteroloni]POM27580.1 Serine/threonine-protein kinase AfsK [Actinomadura rubteroloni]